MLNAKDMKTMAKDVLAEGVLYMIDPQVFHILLEALNFQKLYQDHMSPGFLF